MPRPALALLALAALALPALAGCLEAAPAPATAVAPRPLDPLSPAESLEAVALALADPAVKALLGDERYRVIGASLRTDKALIRAGERIADVHIYRYGSNDVVWPLVDLKLDAVATVAVERFQPRLTGDEVLEAEAAVLADPRVLARVGGSADGLHAIVILVGDEDEDAPCATHRCVEAMVLRDDGSPVGHFLARYDLSAGRVDAVWDVADGGVA